MNEVQMPGRTAGYCDLPNGERVWICTLNSAQRLEAEKHSRRYAATECRSLLKGGEDYASVVAEVRALPLEQQAVYLAQQDGWTIHREVEQAFPLPLEPEPAEGQTPEQYTQAVRTWEEEKASVVREREAEVRQRYESVKADYARLSPKKREEACCLAYHAAEFGQAYLERRSLEMLLRAVRKPDDHLQRRFASIEEVEDQDDPILQALLERYRQLDSLSASDPPTWPSASCGRSL